MKHANLHKQHISQISFLSIFSISFSIFWETLKGLFFLRKHSVSTTIFGSAREKLNDRYYEDAEKLAGELVKRGHSIITGGGGGVMGAGNRGAYNAKGSSIGLNIKLPKEQKINKCLTGTLEFKHIAIRKMILAVSSELYVYFPGGFGTFDELFEVLELIQTKKFLRMPVILYGKDFWSQFDEYIKSKLLNEYKVISDGDECLYKVVDSVEEACQYIDSLDISNNQIGSSGGEIKLQKE